ncbi:hypothetical protein TNCV_5094721 [Trichonephila clavipes]|nr:hypothetical protein TNCV_5094721 [Trichonephila clavipes]
MASMGVVATASSESDDFACCIERVRRLRLQVDGATTHQKVCVFLFGQGHQCRRLEPGTHGFRHQQLLPPLKFATTYKVSRLKISKGYGLLLRNCP